MTRQPRTAGHSPTPRRLPSGSDAAEASPLEPADGSRRVELTSAALGPPLSFTQQERARRELAVRRLLEGKGAVEDLHSVLAVEGTPSERRAIWAALPWPSSSEELDALIAACLELAPADRETARDLRHLFQAICANRPAPSLFAWTQWIGADLTFCEHPEASGPLRRERLIAIRSARAPEGAKLIFEHRGEVAASSLSRVDLSVIPLRVVLEAPPRAREEHLRVAADLNEAATAELNRVVAEAHRALADQHARLGLPADDRTIPVLWSRNLTTLARAHYEIDEAKDEVQVWVEVNPRRPHGAEFLKDMAHELSHARSERAVHLRQESGLEEWHRRPGEERWATARVDWDRRLTPQFERVIRLSRRRADVYESGRAPVPDTLAKQVEKSRPLPPIWKQLGHPEPRQIVLGRSGHWVTEYLIELGAILAVDPKLEQFRSLNLSVYRPGVLRLAAAYQLAPPEEKRDFERAIVLAGRAGQHHELIQFAARHLDSDGATYFRRHTEDALADPALGGLMEALARPHLLASGGLDELAEAVQPRWVGEALKDALPRPPQV